jgi:hypothetical protein
MSKKRNHHKHKKERNVFEITHDIEIFQRRYIELCTQYESTTNPSTKNGLKSQLDNICTTINDLMKVREQKIANL